MLAMRSRAWATGQELTIRTSSATLACPTTALQAAACAHLGGPQSRSTLHDKPTRGTARGHKFGGTALLCWPGAVDAHARTRPHLEPLTSRLLARAFASLLGMLRPAYLRLGSASRPARAPHPRVPRQRLSSRRRPRSPLWRFRRGGLVALSALASPMGIMACGTAPRSHRRSIIRQAPP